MKKILDLLAKAGCKQELIGAIGESLEGYKNELREQFEADYTAKVEKAKKLCLEETEAYKREMARRMQIFLDTKSAAIESHLARQSAVSESEAMTKLRGVKSLLEGVEIGQVQNGAANADLIEKAKLQIRQLTEERNQAIEKANKQNAIAEKVLSNNRKLVTENARLKALRGNGGSPTVTEGRGAPRGQGKIDGGRRAAQPTTTRPTIVENQTRRPAPQPGQANVRTEGNKGGYNVTDIAAMVDEDLV
jgi:hypothetical protein